MDGKVPATVGDANEFAEKVENERSENKSAILESKIRLDQEAKAITYTIEAAAVDTPRTAQ